MAGKKNRKRQKGSTKKVSQQNENDGSVLVEEKKPKLDDGLAEQAEQSDKSVQEPNLGTPTVADTCTNNDLCKDLQSEESKYVPPFTRKSKRTLQRHRSSVSPDVKSARPKRPWKGKQISKQTRQSLADQQSPADQQTNDMIRAKDSPKMREEEKEEDIDVVELEEVTICTQENRDLVVFSTSQKAADALAVTTDEVLSSSNLATVQEETSNIVMLVIDNVLDAMYKQINQHNSNEITSEFKEEPKASVEERDTHSIINTDIQVTDSSEENDILSEAALEPSIETAVKTVTILTKAALKKTVTGKTASKSVKKCVAMAGFESQTTTLQQQQQNQATTIQSVEGHVHSTQETATSEGAVEKYNTGIIDYKGELPYSLHQNENENRVRQQGNSETDNEPDNQNYTVVSKGECANHRDAEPKNLGIECSPITTPEVKDAVSFNNVITSINEEVHALSTSPIPTNKDLSSKDICSANCVSEKEHHQQRASDDLLKSDGHAGMVHKPNMDTPMLEKELSSTVDSGICGENVNNMCQIDSNQDLDQMVPDNCETTTVMLQENPDVEAFMRKPKRKEIDLEDSAGVCSKQQCTPQVGEREHERRDLDEQMDKIPVVETGTTREMNESCQESPQLPNTSTAQASDIWVDQEPITHEQITMDKTVTRTETPLQSESFCKYQVETVEPHQSVEDEITENQSSKLEAGCSLFGFDGDIMEFDSLIDCTDSQLVHVDDSSKYENLLPDQSQKCDARQLNNSNVAGNSTSSRTHCSAEVPSDKGMIKGLISELSGLNKFIMGAWKDLENQNKRRQARLKLGKMKKLK